ncbi:MAG: hypothetical protein H6963_00125 [Chromatiaceae bacterium]|nr:hypothetical protein [Chromatiaceae bacterium]
MNYQYTSTLNPAKSASEGVVWSCGFNRRENLFSQFHCGYRFISSNVRKDRLKLT